MSMPTVTAAALDRTGVHATLATLTTVVSLSSGRGAGAGQPQTQSGVSFLGSHLDLWSVAGERPLRSLTLENTIVASAEIAPDGRYLAMLSANVSADGQGALYRVYRVASGEVVASFPGDRQSGPIAFSPDSRFVAAETPRHTVTIWNLDANRPVILAEHRSAVTRIAFSPDGTRIATLSSEGITLFDARAGTQLLVLRESSGPFRVREVLVPGKIFTGVTTLAFSDDGRQIIETVMSPDAKGIRVQIKTWDGARN
jgi:WD40 repeat protein